MSNPISCLCVRCNGKLEAPIPETCVYCGFTLDHLSGKKLSDFQKQKREKHTDLLFERDIQLYGSNYNASFDNYDDANFKDLIRFILSYGHHAKLPSGGARKANRIVVAFIPKIVGYGVSSYDTCYDPVPCSGVGIISPASQNYGHGFPVLDDWIQKAFKTERGYCDSCGVPTAFGHPFCHKCYEICRRDWRNFL